MGYIVIGSISPTYERSVRGRKIYILHGSPCRINRYDAEKPHEIFGALFPLSNYTFPKYPNYNRVTCIVFILGYTNCFQTVLV